MPPPPPPGLVLLITNIYGCNTVTSDREEVMEERLFQTYDLAVALTLF